MSRDMMMIMFVGQFVALLVVLLVCFFSPFAASQSPPYSSWYYETQASTTGPGNFRLGMSIATSIDGNIMVMGGPNPSTGAPATKGEVLVFVRRMPFVDYSLNQTIAASAGGTLFGWSVAITLDGGILAVGAPLDNKVLLLSTGTVYIYTRVSGAYGNPASFTPTGSSGGVNIYFGWSVDISGNGTRFVAGGWGNKNTTTNTNYGAVWTYVQSGPPGTYALESILTGCQGATTTCMSGWSVSITPAGTDLVVGAPYDNTRGSSYTGSIAFFTFSGGKWAIVAVVQNPLVYTTPTPWFGAAVRVLPGGQFAIVGAPNDGSTGSGEVYICSGSGCSLKLSGYVTTPALTNTSRFGISLSVSWTGASTNPYGAAPSSAEVVIVVGANGTLSNQGAVYSFIVSSSGTVTYINATTRKCTSCTIGSAVALSLDSSTLLAGAPAGAGSGYAFYAGCDLLSSYPSATASTTTCPGPSGLFFALPGTNCSFSCTNSSLLPLPGTSMNNVCKNGAWTSYPSPGTCVPANCTTPGDTASVAYTGNCLPAYGWGGVCSPQCQPLYTASGSLSITCNLGTWTSAIGSCIPVNPTAFYLTAPATGTVVSTTNRGPNPTYSVVMNWTMPISFGCTGVNNYCQQVQIIYDTNPNPTPSSPNYHNVNISNPSGSLAQPNCATSYVATGLTAGTWYWYVIITPACIPTTTVQSQNTWSFCLASYPQPPVVAYAPVGLTPSSGVTVFNQPTFQWSTPQMGVGCSAQPPFIQVLIDNTTNPVTLVSTLPGTATNYSTSGLVVPMKYYWKAIFNNGFYQITVPCNACPLGNPFFTTCSPQTVPTPSLIFPAASGVVDAVASTNVVPSLTLLWSAPFTDTCGQGYLYSRTITLFISNTSSTGPFTSFTLPPTASNYTFANQTVGVYWWYVVAQGYSGPAGAVASPTWKFTVCSSTPPAPVTLSSPPNTSAGWGASVALQWSVETSFGTVCPGVSQVNSYRVYLSTTNPPWGTLVSTQTNPTASSFTANSLTTNTYYWGVAVDNANIENSPTYSAVFSFSVCIVPTPGPSTPVSPSNNTVNVSPSPTLSWSPAAFNLTCGPASTYVVFLDSVCPPVASTTYPSTQTAVNVSSLSPDGTWCWAVQPYNGAVPGPVSPVYTFTTCTPNPPSPFTLSTPLNGDGSQLATPHSVTLSWNPTSSFNTKCAGTAYPANSYIVYLANITNPTTVVAVVPFTASVTSFVTNLTLGTYYWKVQAINTDGAVYTTAVWSFSVNTACAPSAPSAPSLASPTGAIVPSTVTFKWIAASLGTACCSSPQASGYNILLGNTTTPSTQVNTGGPIASTSYTTSSALSSGVWYWTVNATNGCQSTLSGAVDSFCVPSSPSAAAPQTPVTYATNQPPSGTLTWQSPSSWGDAVCAPLFNLSHSITLYLDQNIVPSTAVLSGAAGTVTSFSYSGLAAGTYNWMITVTNGVASATSSISVFTVCIVSTPQNPLLVSPANASINQPTLPTLTWSSPSGSFGTPCGTSSTFTVFLSQTLPLVFVATLPSSTTSFTPSTALGPGLWYWAVQASNGAATNASNLAVDTFVVCVQTPPSSPQLLTPPDATTGLQQQPANITLTWTTPASWGTTCGVAGANVFQILLQAGTAQPTVVIANVSSSVTLFNVTLTPGNYAWQIRAFNTGTPSQAATTSIFTFTVATPACDPTSPTAPALSSPAANVLTGSSVTLAWTPAAFGLDCNATTRQSTYFVTVNSVTVATVSAPNVTAVVTGTANTAYQWYVSAFNGNESAYAVSPTFTFCVAGPPNPSTLLSPLSGATVVGVSVPLNWTAPTAWGDNIPPCPVNPLQETQRLYVDSSPSPSTLVSTLSGTATSFTFTAPAAGTYYWKILSSNGVVTTASTQTYSFVVCVISTPTAVSLIQPAPGAVDVVATATLQWSASTFGFSCGTSATYTILLDTVNPPVATFAQVTGATTTSYTVPAGKLVTGIYYWTVVPANGGANIGPAADVGNFTVCIPTAPSPIALLSPSQTQSGLPIAPTTIPFSWTATASFGLTCGAGGSNNYTLFIDTASTPVTVQYSGGLTSFSVAFPPGTYNWRVVATNAAGLSTQSTEIRSFVLTPPCTRTPPLAPVVTGPANNYFTSVAAPSFSLTWSAISYGLTCLPGQTDDVIVYLGQSNPPALALDFGTGAAANVSYLVSTSALQPNSQYFWYVNGTNGVDWAVSPVSSFCVVVPPQAATGLSPTSGVTLLGTPTTLTWTAMAGSAWGDGQGCGNAARSITVILDTNPTPTTVVSSSLLSTATSFTLPLSGGATYYWLVRVSNGLYTVDSAVSSFSVCIVSVPSVPTLSLPNDGYLYASNTPSLQWDASAFGQSCSLTQSYTVYLSSTNPPTVSVATGIAASTLSYSVPSATPLAVGQWFWSVAAQNGDTVTSGAASPAFSFTVCDHVAPQLGTVTPAAGSTVANTAPVTWTVLVQGIPCDGSSPTLLVYISNTSFVNITETNTPVVAQTGSSVASGSYSPPSLPFPDGEYYVLVMLTSGPDVVTLSTSFVVCTKMAPAAPSLLSPSDGATGLVTSPAPSLQWSPSSSFGNSCGGGGSDRYDLYLSTSSPPSFYASFSSSTTSMTLPNLASGVWYWNVVAVNAAGLTNAATTTGYSFSICQILNPTNPTILLPLSNSFLAGPAVNVSWKDTVDFTGGSSCAATCPGTSVNSFAVVMSLTQLFTSSDVRATVPGTMFQATGSVTTASVYYVYVEAISCFGTTSYSLPVVVFVCLDTAPSVATLQSPAAGATVGTSVSLQWTLPANLGVVCQVAGKTPPAPVVEILMGTSPSRMKKLLGNAAAGEESDELLRRRGGSISGAPSVVETLSVAGQQSTVIANLSQGTTYYWAVQINNGAMTSTTSVQSFATTLQGCASLNCDAQHSTCNTLLVLPNCTCETGFGGATCSQAVCADGTLSAAGTTSCAGAAKQSIVGVVIGPIIGIFAICALVAMLAYVRRKKAEVEKENQKEHVSMVYTADDYSKFAFVMPKKRSKKVFKDATMDVEGWRHFVNFLNPLQEEFVVCQAILESAPSTELDQVSRSLVFVLEYRRLGLDYVKFLITQEVLVAVRPNTLFRGNSPASKSFVSYAKIPCLPYLFRTVALLVHEIIELDVSQSSKEKAVSKMTKMSSRSARKDSEGTELMPTTLVVDTRPEALYSGDVELDPHKMQGRGGGGDGDDDAEDTSGITQGVTYENVLALSLLCQRFISAIKKSAAHMPPELKAILVHVRYCVDQRFGNNAKITAKAIGSHLLLRLINPAILLPESYGISQAVPSALARRKLLLVTKVLQNLSNDVRFGNKEAHMSPMNDFLENNQDSWNEFLLSLGEASGAATTTEEQRVTTFIDEEKKSSKAVETTVDEGDNGPLTVPQDLYLAHATYLAVFVHEFRSHVVEHLKSKFDGRGQDGNAAVQSLDKIMSRLPVAE